MYNPYLKTALRYVIGLSAWLGCASAANADGYYTVTDVGNLQNVSESSTLATLACAGLAWVVRCRLRRQYRCMDQG